MQRGPYDFLDPRLSDFYDALSHVVDVAGWVHGIRALSPQLNFAWNEAAIMEWLFPRLPDLPPHNETLREITQASNDFLFRVVEDMSYVFSDGKANVWSAEALQTQCQRFLDRLLRERNAFVLRNQALFLQVLQQDAPKQVAYA